jgi:hypothetical protein
VRGGRIAIAAVVAALLGLVFAASATACSCAPIAPAEALAESDAAIVGRLLAVAPQGAIRAEYRHEVLRVYRGRSEIERGAVLKVLSPKGSAACGLPDQVGARTGLFLSGKRGRWSSGLCGVISPGQLRAAAQRAEGGQAGGSAVYCAS